MKKQLLKWWKLLTDNWHGKAWLSALPSSATESLLVSIHFEWMEVKSAFSEICFLFSPGRLKTKHYEIRHYRRNVARTLSNHSQFLPAHFEEIIKHKSRRASCRMLQKFHYEIKAKMQVHWNKNASLSLNYLHLIEVSTYSYDLKAARLRPNSFQLSSGRRVSQGVIWPKSVHYFVN